VTGLARQRCASAAPPGKILAVAVAVAVAAGSGGSVSSIIRGTARRVATPHYRQLIDPDRTGKAISIGRKQLSVLKFSAVFSPLRVTDPLSFRKLSKRLVL
jgi:uncharacterized protein (DUF2252 family)